MSEGSKQLSSEPGQSEKTSELVLYKFDACPYCRKTMRAIDRLGVVVRYRDTNNDAGAWEELKRIGGKDQVPCLLVNGKPMYESDDIIAFLETRVAAGAQGVFP